jgi:hypothetical protein
VSDLPRDANGRSYVDLAQAKEEWQSIVPVARGLSRGVHTLELVAAGNANLDGFTIPEVDNPAPPWLVIVPLVVFGMINSYFLYKELRVRR